MLRAKCLFSGVVVCVAASVYFVINRGFQSKGHNFQMQHTQSSSNCNTNIYYQMNSMETLTALHKDYIFKIQVKHFLRGPVHAALNKENGRNALFVVFFLLETIHPRLHAVLSTGNAIHIDI